MALSGADKTDVLLFERTLTRYFQMRYHQFNWQFDNVAAVFSKTGTPINAVIIS